MNKILVFIFFGLLSINSFSSELDEIRNVNHLLFKIDSTNLSVDDKKSLLDARDVVIKIYERKLTEKSIDHEIDWENCPGTACPSNPWIDEY